MDEYLREQFITYRWALARIHHGDATGDPGLDACGYGAVPDAEELAHAALRGDDETVRSVLPSGLTEATMKQV